jgi:hypothetical protein
LACCSFALQSVFVGDNHIQSAWVVVLGVNQISMERAIARALTSICPAPPQTVTVETVAVEIYFLDLDLDLDLDLGAERLFFKCPLLLRLLPAVLPSPVSSPSPVAVVVELPLSAK